MRFELFLALRYLRTPRKHRLANLTALAAVIGIAFGAAALIVANAVADGFRAAMQEKILANTAHITVLRRDRENIIDWRNLSAKIQILENVESVSATSFDNALLIGKTNSSYAVLRSTENYLIDKSVKTSELKPMNFASLLKIEIGRELAEKTGLSIGDAAEIVSGGNYDDGFAPATAKVEICNIFSTGLYEYDAVWIRISPADIEKLTGRPNAVTALEIKTANFDDSDKTALQIEKLLNADFKILDWREANRPLFAALTLERRAIVLIISLILLIAALNITTTMALIVNERKFDIAVLKACGARRKSVVLIFLFEGMLLGLSGVGAGALLGVIGCLTSNFFHLISLPPDVYSISEIVLQPTFQDVSLIFAGGLMLSLIAAAIPAWTAARKRVSGKR